MIEDLKKYNITNITHFGFKSEGEQYAFVDVVQSGLRACDGCVLSTIYPTNNIGKTTVRYELCRILGGEICEAHYEEGELHQLQIKKV